MGQYWARKLRRVLVEQARFNKSDWLRMFNRLVKDIAAHRKWLTSPGSSESGALDPREPLIWSYCTLLAMPDALRQDYKRLAERTPDRTGIEDMLDELRARDYQFRGPPGSHDLRLRWLATLVRALDADLAQFHFDPNGGTDEDWSTDCWAVSDYDCYVVPVDRWHRLRGGKPAERRAMRYHAIIPAKIGDYEVSLVRHSSLMPVERLSQPKPYLFGAPIFEDLRLTIKEIGESEFLVTGVVCDNQWNQLIEVHGKACADRCDVLVWPELTVTAGLAAQLSGALAQRARNVRSKVDVIVPGSWHVYDDESGSWRNRALVMDGRGNVLVRYDKRMKFLFKKRMEAIQPGNRLPVIVMEDRLIAIAICLDFCNDCEASVYPALDLDLVLVPSMGPPVTMDAHARHARILQSLRDTGVFVVQQVPVLAGEAPPANVPPGYSMVTPAGRSPPAPEQQEGYRPLRAAART